MKSFFRKDFLLWILIEDFIDEKNLLKKGTDQSTVFHKAIYTTFDQPSFFALTFGKTTDYFLLK